MRLYAFVVQGSWSVRVNWLIEVVELVGAKSLMGEARGLEASASAGAGGYK